jgi:hypothetical protein
MLQTLRVTRRGVSRHLGLQRYLHRCQSVDDHIFASADDEFLAVRVFADLSEFIEESVFHTGWFL